MELLHWFYRIVCVCVCVCDDDDSVGSMGEKGGVHGRAAALLSMGRRYMRLVGGILPMR